MAAVLDNQFYLICYSLTRLIPMLWHISDSVIVLQYQRFFFSKTAIS
jgi:hypothetical protein